MRGIRIVMAKAARGTNFVAKPHIVLHVSLRVGVRALPAVPVPMWRARVKGDGYITEWWPSSRDALHFAWLRACSRTCFIIPR